MEEDKEKKEVEETPEDSGDSLSRIDEAKGVVEELRAENDRKEALLAREEAMKVQEVFDGKANAGQAAPKKEEEISAEDYAKQVMSGAMNGKD